MSDEYAARRRDSNFEMVSSIDVRSYNHGSDASDLFRQTMYYARFMRVHAYIDPIPRHPQTELTPITSPWPSTSGIDIAVPFPVARSVKFLIVLSITSLNDQRKRSATTQGISSRSLIETMRLRGNRANDRKPRGTQKAGTIVEGPYEVRKPGKGSYKLRDMDGRRVAPHGNICNLKKSIFRESAHCKLNAISTMERKRTRAR
ncbi:hypothetical protein Tco_0990687 [Tanacetum coccineum]|uniref:Uncharacterized protein n=1 Tax=Tanacetum coccineum TaxID=301880 RepID=A0ABQ5EX57_9ASTR